jgi:Protein of unknown function (DUF4242)
MPKYLIEREIPGAGEMSPEALRESALLSRDVATAMGPDIHWLHSYISHDKVYCIYFAANEELIREHARRGGFPVNVISEIKSTVDISAIEA